MTARALLAASLAAAGACSGSSTPTFPPSVILRIALPVEVAPASVGRMTLTLRSATGQAPSVTAGNLGAQVRTVQGDGGSASETEVRFSLAPFITGTASVLLGAVPGTATASGDPFTVQARVFRGDGAPLAEGAAPADTTGQPIRFASSDVFVDIPLTCVLAGGCAADAGPPDAGPPDAGPVDAGPVPVMVQGQVLDLFGEPFVGARVLLGGGAPVTADGDGGFAVSNVTPPYDLAVVAPSQRTAVSWFDVSTAAPRASLTLPSNPDGGPTTRNVTVSVSYGRFLTGSTSEVVIASRNFAVEQGLAVSFLGQVRMPVPAAPPTTAVFNLSWTGPPSIDLVIAGAEAFPVSPADGGDAGPSSPMYYTFGIARVAITDGVNTSLFLNLRVVDTPRLHDVAATGAAALPLRRFYPMIDFDGVQLALPLSPAAGYAQSTFPILPAARLADLCPTCKQFVSVLARDAESCGANVQQVKLSATHSAALDAMATATSLTLLDPPDISAPPLPVDGGAADAGVFDGSPPPAAPLAYSFTAPPEFASHVAVAIRAASNRDAHSLWTTRPSGTFPDLRVIDAGLPIGRYLYLVLSLTDPAFRPDAVLQAARASAVLPGTLCDFLPPLGSAPGTSSAVNLRVVELMP